MEKVEKRNGVSEEESKLSVNELVDGKFVKEELLVKCRIECFKRR